jgi:hypothetical protein
MMALIDARRVLFVGGCCLVAASLSAQTATQDARKNDDTCAWTQWGQNAAHQGALRCADAQPAERSLVRVTIDPFTERELAETNGNLLTHYQVPLIDRQGTVFVLAKTGTYVSCDPPGSGTPAPCGVNAWASQVWTERALVWKRKKLVEAWRVTSDWKPVPAAPWEPMFQPALAGGFLYLPAAGGTLLQVNASNGALRRRINPFGKVLRADAYVTGGVTADRQGNVYYNVIELDPAAPWTADARGWLVKTRPNGKTWMASYSSLVPDAPAPDAPCYTTFAAASPLPPRPWPPPPPQPGGAPTLPPQVPCLSQRPGVNVTPAVGADGRIFTVSRAHGAQNYGYLVAVWPNLSPAWVSSLRDRLNDGCGVRVPFGSAATSCRPGAAAGVDPNTNLPPAGAVSDASSSSPTALPDGGVVYGAVSNYNNFRGHLFKFDSGGGFAGSFDYGWDTTPAVYAHDGTYSLVLKDNHYTRYVGEALVEGPFSITQLDADLAVEWSFDNTNHDFCQRLPDGTVGCELDPEHFAGWEWCVNALAVDARGTVHVTAEDGFYYAIAQGGVEQARFFLTVPRGAAYTPLALDARGRIYAMNDGVLHVLGRR